MKTYLKYVFSLLQCDCWQTVTRRSLSKFVAHVVGVPVCFYSASYAVCDLQDINRLRELLKSPHKQSLSLQRAGDQVALITFGLLGVSPARGLSSMDGWITGWSCS